MTEDKRGYECPYCKRVSMSPGGLKFHVTMDHSDKVEEFQTTHYPAMKERFDARAPR